MPEVRGRSRAPDFRAGDPVQRVRLLPDGLRQERVGVEAQRRQERRRRIERRQQQRRRLFRVEFRIGFRFELRRERQQQRIERYAEGKHGICRIVVLWRVWVQRFRVWFVVFRRVRRQQGRLRYLLLARKSDTDRRRGKNVLHVDPRCRVHAGVAGHAETFLRVATHRFL
jgi:hypothetical protein